MSGRRKGLLVLMLMAVLVVLLLGRAEGLSAKGNEEAGKIEVIDMAGRTVTIPIRVDKVFSLTPTGTILLYSLEPEKILGWNYTLKEEEKLFIDERYHYLPNLGGSGGEAINIEEVLKLNPDLLILMEDLDDSSRIKAKEMEERTDKPVVLLNSSLRSLDEAYILLGRVLGEEERAGKLAQYCKKTMADIDRKISLLKEDEKVRVYYAEGPKGLETEPCGSWHMEAIEVIGAVNVADVALGGYKGKSAVSMEQLLQWDPDLIISWGDDRGGYYSGILADPNWQHIKAVKDKKVYEIPNRPFNWLDRPPSVNRLLGVKWLGYLLYPRLFDFDIYETVREFYQMFYNYRLTDDELSDLLAKSL